MDILAYARLRRERWRELYLLSRQDRPARLNSQYLGKYGEGGQVSDLFKGVCDYCGRESLPTNMYMCNECAEKEEVRA